MKAKTIKNIAVIAVFFLMLCIPPLCSLFLPDAEISRSERRQLAQFESFSEKKDGRAGYGLREYFDFLEDYLLDQYPTRDVFRRVSALWKTGALRQKDNAGYYRLENGLYKLDGSLNKNAVRDAVERINEVYTRYFSGIEARAYYAVIPDKSYYTAESSGYPRLNWDGLFEIVEDNIDGNIKKIDLTGVLGPDDYYVTDPHWSQPEILPCADTLSGAMGRSPASDRDFRRHELYPFYGAYYGHSALGGEPDSLCYLTDSVTDAAEVFNFETGENTGLYDEANFDNTDPYDVFLQGAAALLRIDNPSQENGRQLVLFRDSFGSSIAPLLMGDYSQVIVADIRYVSPSILGKLVDFDAGCDVLFLYSSSVLNSTGAFMR